MGVLAVAVFPGRGWDNAGRPAAMELAKNASILLRTGLGYKIPHRVFPGSCQKTKGPT